MFHHFYSYLPDLKAEEWTKLPNFILDELRAAALSLPFVEADIRAQFANFAIATDATPKRGGATRCDMPTELGLRLYT